jgi:hypothetical protein
LPLAVVALVIVGAASAYPDNAGLSATICIVQLLFAEPVAE